MLVDEFGKPLANQKSPRHKPVMNKVRLTTDRDNFHPYTDFDQAITAEQNLDWKFESLSERELATKSASDLIKTLVNSSPDLSRAHSDMQMYINTGFELTTTEDDTQAQAVLDSALQTMEKNKEPLSVKIDKMTSSMFLKGAIYAENIFGGEFGEEFVDIKVLDPFRVAYREEENSIRGQYTAWGEVRNGQFVEIDSDFVQYIPVNPLDDSPLGTPMVGSAIFPIVFLSGMLKSVRQIVESQAWPLGLITIDGEKMIAGGSSDVDTLKEDIENLTKDIEQRFKGASLNEVFIYGAEVAYQIVSGMGKANLDAVEMLQKILDKWIVRALKQFPVVFGLAEGNSLSTNAEQQLEAHAIFINALQSKIETLFSFFFTQILRNVGSMAMAILRLKRTNALLERYRAERMKIKSESIAIWVTNRWVTNQEARQLIRDPESFDNLSDVLDAELPESLTVEEPSEPDGFPADLPDGVEPEME